MGSESAAEQPEGRRGNLGFVLRAHCVLPLVEMLLMVREGLSGEVTSELGPQRRQRVRHVMMCGKGGHACHSLDAVTLGAGWVSHHLLLDEVAGGRSRRKGFGSSHSSPSLCADQVPDSEVCVRRWAERVPLEAKEGILNKQGCVNLSQVNENGVKITRGGMGGCW